MNRIFYFFIVSFFIVQGVRAEVSNDSALLHQQLFTIRNPLTDLKDFRSSLEKIGEYMGAQVLQSLDKKNTEIVTLVGAKAVHSLPQEQPVLLTILRAGLPLLVGVQRVFPNSEVGFIAMSRDEETLQPKTDYVAMPQMSGKIVVIVDTMLATGGSMIDVIKIVKKSGPKKIILISAVADREGIVKISTYDSDIQIFSAVIDPTLNEKGYIVPGLGDAGDRSFGPKVAIKE